MKLFELTRTTDVEKVQRVRAKAFDAVDKLFFNLDHTLRAGEDSLLRKLVRDGNVPAAVVKPVEAALAELGHALVALHNDVMKPKKDTDEAT